MYMSSTFVYRPLFVCHFVPPCEVSEGLLQASAYVRSYFVYLSALVRLINHLH